MATKVNAAAAGAKRRQQIIVLAVGGVLLAGLVMLQAPKIMHHGKKSSTTSASTSASSSSTDSATSNTTTSADTGSTTGSTTTPSATPATPAPAPITANGPAAKVAGVIVRSAGAPLPAEGHLWSLSRFKARDPFVQQVSDASAAAAPGPSGSTSASKTASSGGSTPAAGGVKTGTGKVSVVVPTTITPAAIAYVTLMVNGNAQQLTLKDVFPKAQPTFVVRGVAKNVVKIGVAGGKFVGGAVVKLELGKAVTLMNTATGQRFVMKLVYTGSQPEQIAGFKTPGVPSATTPAVVVPSTTPATTAAPKA
jgi:hypothetical protein